MNNRDKGCLSYGPQAAQADAAPNLRLLGSPGQVVSCGAGGDTDTWSPQFTPSRHPRPV